MAKRNGKKDPIEQVVEHLAALRTELKSEIGALRTELKTELSAVRTELSGEIGSLRHEMHLGFEKVNLRLDHLIENTGTHYRKLEARVAALEAKVH